MSLIPASWDRRAAQGSLAVRVEEHVIDGAENRPVVAGLRLTDLGSGITAPYRAGSALYGFLGLPAGSRRILVEDQTDRYVPRLLIANVPDRAAAGRLLEADRDPKETAATRAALLVTTVLRPGVGYPVPSGQPALWGDVIDASGAPAPYAMVRVALGATRSWTTTTDATGRFLVWLRGLPERDLDDGDWTLSLEIRGRTNTSADPTDLLPDDLDALDAAGRAAWYDRALGLSDVVVPQRAKKKLDTITIP